MAFALVGTIGTAVQTAAGGDATTQTFGASETRAFGNLLIAFLSVTKSATLPATPAGWYLAVSQSGSNSVAAAIYYRNAAGSDAAPTFTHPDGTALIAVQLAEYSGVLATIDRSGSATATSSPVTATNGGADGALNELMVIASGDTRSVSRAPNDTLTSNHVTAVTAAGNNNGVSNQTHYSFGYGSTNSTASADTSVLTPSVTTSITGLAIVNAVFKLGVGTFMQYGQAQADIKAFGVNGFAQAQAKLNAFNVEGFAQAQADILATSRGYAQAQAKIPVPPMFAYSQAQGQVAQYLFLDTFTRIVSNNLGTADNSDTWVLSAGSATNASVNGTNGILLTDNTQLQRWRLPNTIITTLTNEGLEISGSISSNKQPATQSVSTYFGIGASDGTQLNVLSVAFDPTRITLSAVMGGSSVGSVQVVYTAGDTYNFKGHLLPVSNAGTFFRGKLWKVGTTEPGWTPFSDLSIPITSNQVTIVNNPDGDANTPFTITIDNFKISNAALTQYGQAQAKISLPPINVFAQAQATIYFSAGVYYTPPTFGNNNADGIDFPYSSQFTNDYIDFTGGNTWISGSNNAVTVGFKSTSSFYAVSAPLKSTSVISASHLITRVKAWVSLGVPQNINSLNDGIELRIFKILTTNEWEEIPFTSTSEDVTVSSSPDFSFTTAPKVRIEGDIGLTTFLTGERVVFAFRETNGSQKTVAQPDPSEDAGHLSASDGPIRVYLSGEQITFSVAPTISEMDRTFVKAQAQAQIIAFDVERIAQAQTFITTPFGFANAQAFTAPGYVNKIAWAQATIVGNGVIVRGQALALIGPAYTKFSQAQAYMNRGPGTPRYAQSQAFITQMLGRTGFAQAMAYIPGDWYILYDEFDNSYSSNQFTPLYIPQMWRINAQGTNKNIEDQSSLIHSGSSESLIFNDLTSVISQNSPISYTMYIKFKWVGTGSNQILMGITNRITYRVNDTSVAGNPATWRLSSSSNGFIEKLVIANNEWAWMRIDWDNVNNLVYAKIWRDGYAEPSTWTINGSPNVGPMSLALSEASGTTWIDEIRVTPLGQTRAFRWRSAQAQAQIVPGAAFTTTNQFAQGQADILVTTNQFAQSQADIKVTTSAFAQSQADIKVTTNVFAQSQADIKVTTNQFSQANVDIKNQATNYTNPYAQANADIKVTTNVFAQSQADIKVTSNGFAQAQSDIKVTTNVFSQAQADIKVTNNQFSQAQADIKATTNQFAQSQADIKATSNGFAQSQADIKAVGNGFSQAQADVKAVNSGYAQSQADILVTTNRFAQANADIKATSNVFSQAQADVKTTYRGYGQSQADIKTSYQGYAQAQTDIKTSYTQSAQSQADILVTTNRFAQSQADIKATNNGFAQVNADILTYNQGYSQAQAKLNAFGVDGFAQAQGNIKGDEFEYAQAQAKINAFGVSNYAQSQADIVTSYQDYAQANAQIVQTDQRYAQAQSSILATTNQFAQTNADIKVTTTTYGQAQADIKQIYQGYANAQTDIVTHYYGEGQAQSDIKVITLVFAQAQSDILVITNKFAQSQTDIKQTYQWYANAQSDILVTYVGCANAQAKIKQTYNGFGQTNTSILATSNGFGQSNADIKKVTNGFGQAQTSVITGTRGSATAQADIKAISRVEAQAQTDIRVTTNQFGQAQSDIRVTSKAFSQAQTTIKVISSGYAQSQSSIKVTQNKFAQSQSDIVVTAQGYGQAQTKIAINIRTIFAQAQASILIVSEVYAQAQGQIHVTTNAFAQSQATVITGNHEFAQAQANIRIIVNKPAQAQAAVISIGTKFAQSQALIVVIGITQSAQAQAAILNTYQGYAQAQALIVLFAFGQARAYIKILHVLKKLEISERYINLSVTDRIAPQVETTESTLHLTVTDRVSVKIDLPERTIHLTLLDRDYI